MGDWGSEHIMGSPIGKSCSDFVSCVTCIAKLRATYVEYRGLAPDSCPPPPPAPAVAPVASRVVSRVASRLVSQLASQLVSRLACRLVSRLILKTNKITPPCN